MSDEQEYITITQAAQKLGWNKATVYDWMKTLGMEKHKFLRNKNSYIYIRDFERIKEVKEKPWTAGPNTAKRDRNIAEKVKKQSVPPKSIDDTKTIEKPQKSTTKQKKDTGLPAGAILAIDFARNHDVKRETFRDHMTIGKGPGTVPGEETHPTLPIKDHVDYSERPKSGRPKEKEKYLTSDQQLEAIQFWKRHDVSYSQCERPNCPCH